MKKLFAWIIALLLAACAFAEAENPAVLYQQIMDADHISLADAYDSIASAESDVMEVVEFQQLLADLKACEGRYLQLPEEGGSGKTYSADLTFYFESGAPMCNILYTNYAGDIDDGAVEILSGSEYLFATHPAGAFHSRNTVFTIEIAPDKLHIQWGDGVCDYTLVRGDEEQQASADVNPAFTETENYAILVQAADNTFGELEHACHYDPDSRTFTVCAALGSGYRDTLFSGKSTVGEKWQELLATMAAFTKDMDEVLTILTRESLAAYSEAQFTILFAEELSPDGLCSESDQLARITDGVIVYDVSKDGILPDGGASIGENNALRQAKDYLSFIPFSYNGLISQLEYDGYTNVESVYAADHCGADWYGQAVKSACDYLSVIPFSFDGLVQQLEYDGYTNAEALYGAENCGADWFEQAVKSAVQYLELMPFSRAGLIEQLEYDGYTNDQAVYAAEQNGY